MQKRVVAIVSGLLLSGCVTAIKENEVNAALSGVGFLERDRACLAARAARQLSIRQLRQIQAAANAMDKPITEMTIGDAIARLQRHIDPATVRVMANVAKECAMVRIEGQRS
jgi:outer membrane murein-binding lipoprotein Lpp